MRPCRLGAQGSMSPTALYLGRGCFEAPCWLGGSRELVGDEKERGGRETGAGRLGSSASSPSPSH